MSEDSPVSTAEEARRRWLPATRPQLLRRDFCPSGADGVDKDPEGFSVMQWNVLAYGLSAECKDGTNQVVGYCSSRNTSAAAVKTTTNAATAAATAAAAAAAKTTIATTTTTTTTTTTATRGVLAAASVK